MPRDVAQVREKAFTERPNRITLAKFFKNVSRDTASGCWNWSTRSKQRYGGFAFTSAHRWTCHWFNAPVPAEMEVDHLCRNTRCVNPAHLEPVTRKENRRRFEATRTHCKQGHPRDIYWNDVYGRCMECSRQWSMACFRKKNPNPKLRSSQRTHCPQGHAYADQNVAIRFVSGRRRRVCKACARAYQHRRKQILKQGAVA